MESGLSLSLHSSDSWSVTNNENEIKYDMQSQSDKTVLVYFNLNIKSVDVNLEGSSISDGVSSLMF